MRGGGEHGCSRKGNFEYMYVRGLEIIDSVFNFYFCTTVEAAS